MIAPSASFDFRSPLHFEDEVEVIVRVEQVTRRTIHYGFLVTRGETRIGTGVMIAPCAARGAGGSLRAAEVPAGVADRLRAAAGQTP